MQTLSNSFEKWSIIEKLMFRFCCLYFAVYIFFTPNNEIPVINNMYEWLNDQLHSFIPWFAKTFFGYKTPITMFTNGSGDTTYDYMLWFFWYCTYYFRHHYMDIAGQEKKQLPVALLLDTGID